MSWNKLFSRYLLRICHPTDIFFFSTVCLFTLCKLFVNLHLIPNKDHIIINLILKLTNINYLILGYKSFFDSYLSQKKLILPLIRINKYYQF